ncbi:hypothetical protein B0T17DRAFT_521531 [Bombardia bombarda]|uniref:Secreted protein n=1 Tax=Bombardia bombarda TaxID=252184 RepID=A0AA39XQ78_9PEZI|nr:hypothetical protein B0T17DRAFT_521531 [Bombardia bombarda]
MGPRSQPITPLCCPTLHLALLSVLWLSSDFPFARLATWLVYVKCTVTTGCISSPPFVHACVRACSMVLLIN